MEEEESLIKKVKHLLKEANAPKRLHRFGPKMYDLWHHVFALFVRTYCQLSYRRTTKFLKLLGFKCPTKSTIQRYADKLRLPFWQSILQKTIAPIELLSIDGSGFERTTASMHYCRRIDSMKPYAKGFHVSIAVNEKGNINGIRIRSKPAHDVKDVKFLLRNLKSTPKFGLLDKGYDAEWIHAALHKRGIIPQIPRRKNARRGFFRKRMLFDKNIYSQRNIVESTFHAIKQKFGASVSSKLITSARSDMYCRAILHNLFVLITRLLGQSQKLRNISSDWELYLLGTKLFF